MSNLKTNIDDPCYFLDEYKTFEIKPYNFNAELKRLHRKCTSTHELNNLFEGALIVPSHGIMCSAEK